MNDPDAPPRGELILVRHGATAWSGEGKHTGRTDISLTAEGEQQAQAINGFLRGQLIALALVSPLVRARRTAELAGIADFGLDPDLQEWDYGGYEGRTTAEIRAQRPGWQLWRDGVPAGDAAHPGETVEDVGVRADRVIARVTPVLAAGDVVLVAHGHLLRVLAARWLGLPARDGGLLAFDTAAVSLLGFEHRARVVRRWNLQPS